MNEIKQTYEVALDQVRQPPKIEISQEPFYLTEVDFLHLINGRPKPMLAAMAILLTSVGYMLVLGAKLASTHIFNSVANVQTWEWVAVALGIGVSIIIYVLTYFFIPNNQETIKKEIETHFKNSPRARKLVGQMNE